METRECPKVMSCKCNRCEIEIVSHSSCEEKRNVCNGRGSVKILCSKMGRYEKLWKCCVVKLEDMENCEIGS
jgi:hypothetical protein